MSASRSALVRASRALTLPLAAVVAALGGAGAAQAEEVVNVYSYREPALTDPIFKTFTDETGIKVNVVYSRDGLIERIAAEARNSPADLLLTPDSGLLIRAKEAGITQPLKSELLEREIDARLRDSEGHWFGLTRRARVVYASKDRVKQESITYEELADPKWKGKICSRSGQHTYNIALIASIIAHDGEEKAETWLTGLRDNLARKPAGGDREGVRDVQAGLCDLAIGNTYYMAAMLKNPEQKAWAESVRILFPNADGRGTHVNISGAALIAHAPHRDNAVKLLEFLASPEAQAIYAERNGEYPALIGAKTSDLVKSWGELKADSIPLSDLAKLRQKASELVDKVRFDAGPAS
jgi:iron(III) transport system substrate-binding protein